MTAEVFGPYRLHALLGSGGMGEVWQAFDTRKDREVAVKVLGTWVGADPDFGRRFRREAALAAKLTGPHIIPIHDYGDVDGRLYIEMPLIDGVSLDALLRRDGPLPPERAVGIVTQVARALAAAHRTGLVHRDVKPANILIDTRDAADHVYLIDFGIARAVDDDAQITRSGAVLGTPAYMAPERFVGPGDHRGDIYALGCVLHQALTAEKPFPAANLLGAVYAHQNLPPPRPSRVRRGVPPGLDAVTSRAMAKDPDLRYPSALDLATAARDALTAAGAAPPEPPPPPGRQPEAVSSTIDTEVVAAPPRRRRRRVTAAALVVVGLLAAAIAAVSPASGGGAPAAATDPTASAPPALLPATFAERVLDGDVDGVFSVATAELEGRSVIISGGGHGTVQVWDLATGTPLGQPLTSQDPAVTAVAVAALDGRPVIVSSGIDSMRVWDLATHAPVGEPFAGVGTTSPLAIAQTGGGPVVIAGGGDGTTSIWDIRTRTRTGDPLPSDDGEAVLAVATTQLNGTPVIVTGSWYSLRVWDLAFHTRVGEPLVGHTGLLLTVTAAELDGKPVIISGSDGDTVQMWDLATQTALGGPMTGHTGAVRAVVTAEIGGRLVIVSGGEDRTVRVWDAATRTPIGRPLTGLSGTVNGLATAQVGGRTVLVAGTENGKIYTWDLAAHLAT